MSKNLDKSKGSAKFKRKPSLRKSKKQVSTVVDVTGNERGPAIVIETQDSGSK